MMSTFSIVIPAYNEEESIATVVRQALDSRSTINQLQGIDQVEVIVVNDGSTDGTLRQLEPMHCNELRVVSHEVNRGYGAALKTGFDSSQGNLVGFMDGDGTCDPNGFARLLEPLLKDEAEMVIGSRMDQNLSRMPKIRRIGNRFFAGMLSFLSGKRVVDAASGMRAFRKDVLARLAPLPDGLHYTPAMSAKALHDGLRLLEMPITYDHRQGESKLSVIRDGLRFFFIIVESVLMYDPLRIFSLVGLGIVALAAILMIDPLFALMFSVSKTFGDYIYRSIGALYMVAIGVDIVLFGYLADRMVYRVRFGRQEEWRGLRALLGRHLGWIGFLMIVTGVFINGIYAWEHFFGEGIKLHWSYLLAAAGFLIVGLQSAVTALLVRILRDMPTGRS